MEHLVVWLWTIFTKPPGTVRDLMAALARNRGTAVPPPDLDWTPYSAAAEGGALGALHRFFAKQGWQFAEYPDPMLVDLLTSGLRRLGEPLPEQLLDDALDEIEDEATDVAMTFRDPPPWS